MATIANRPPLNTSPEMVIEPLATTVRSSVGSARVSPAVISRSPSTNTTRFTGTAASVTPAAPVANRVDPLTLTLTLGVASLSGSSTSPASERISSPSGTALEVVVSNSVRNSRATTVVCTRARAQRAEAGSGAWHCRAVTSMITVCGAGPNGSVRSGMSVSVSSRSV